MSACASCNPSITYIGAVQNTMTTNTAAAVAAAAVMPTLDNIATLATFGAFKIDERISFVRRYTPSVQAIPDFRHSVIRYRVTGKDTAEKPANMVTIPQLVLPAEYQALDERARKVILGVFEDAQDDIVRGLIDAQATTVHWDAVSLEAVLTSLTAVRISKRLTKEQIEAWARIAFVEACNTRADQISNEKNYAPEQAAKQRAGTLNAYVELVMKLAAPVPNIGQGNATALNNLFLVAKLDDDMAKVLKGKLHEIMNPEVVKNGDL
jgi:hypothetical protein